MAQRCTNLAAVLLIAMLLPFGTALAQGLTTGTGNASGAAPGPAAAPAPPLASQTYPPAPAPVQGSAEQDQDNSRTGLATTAADGVSIKIVPARPCSTAARETDGTTTCVGIAGRR